MYMSLHGSFVQFQVLLRRSLLHELGAQLINLVSASGHSVRHYLYGAFLFIQLYLRTLQLVLKEARWEQLHNFNVERRYILIPLWVF